MTWGEFRVLSRREQQKIRQRVSQFGATHIGFWKDCQLVKCRRARRCCGFLTEAQYALGYPDAFPPCTRGEEARRASIRYDGLDAVFGGGAAAPKYAGRPSDRNETADPMWQIGIQGLCSPLEQKIFAFAAFDGSFLSSQQAYFLRSTRQLIRWRLCR
jgi:hypothetical protein